MSCLNPSKLVAGLIVLAGLLPVSSAQGQDAGADASAVRPEQESPAAPSAAQPAAQEGPQLVPALGQGGFGRSIEDIDLHRVARAPYVRRWEDVVHLDFGDIDIEADVVMTVAGKPVTRNDFRKRAIMYLAINKVDEEITRIVTETQKKVMIAEGVDPASLEVADADLDEKVENIISVVVMQARGAAGQDDSEESTAIGDKARQDFLDSIDASVGMEAYRQMMGAEVAFEKAFLPMPTEAQEGEVVTLADGPAPADDPKPDWLPQITWDALNVSESSAQLKTFIKSHGSQGKAIPSFFRTQITSTIRLGVIKVLGVQYFFDADLPDDVFLRLGGTDLKVDDLWESVKNDVSDTDIDLVLREMLTLRAVRSTLEAAGQWMDAEQTEEAFAELNAQFEGTLFPLGSIIVLRGYRSLDRYREHWRHKEAYFRWRKKSLTEEEIEDHYRTSGRLFFERGSVEVDLAVNGIEQGAPFCEARFDEAKADMDAAYAVAVEEDGQDAAAFQELAKLFPLPASRQMGAAAESERYFQRNPLRVKLTESELSLFITGYSLADDIFYHGAVGEMFGPYAQRCRRHAWGAELNAATWMARVSGFTRDRPLAPLQGRELEQATEDLLDLSYQYWTQECLKSLLPKVKVTSKG